MRKRKIKFIELGIFLFCLSILLWNCEKDNFIENTDEVGHQKGKHHNEVSMDFFKETTKISNIEKYLRSKEKNKAIANKSTNSNEPYNFDKFEIDTTLVKQLILDTGESSFSFYIKLKENTIEDETYNLVIRKIDSSWVTSVFLFVINNDITVPKKFASINDVYTEKGIIDNLFYKYQVDFVETADYHCVGCDGPCDLCEMCVTYTYGYDVTHLTENYEGDPQGGGTVGEYNGGGGGGSSNTNTDDNQNECSEGYTKDDNGVCVPIPNQIINNLIDEADCVYQKLQNNSLLKKTLERFVGEKTPVHLILNQQSNLTLNGDLVNGLTDYGSSYYITIILNTEQSINRPSLDVARTILHEAIHAEIFRKIKTTSGMHRNSFGQWVLGSGAEADFPTLFKYYQEKEDPQHEYMADYYRTAMEEGLKEYATSIGKTYPDQLYKDLAWSGLRDTYAWENMYADYNYTQSEQQRIINAVSDFLKNKTNECQ